MSDFYKYFKQNMDELGLPAPDSLFGSVQATVGNLTVILTNMDKFGKMVTLGEVIGAATKLEQLSAAASLSASFYVGACIGSLAVAAGRDIAGGVSLADALSIARQNHIHRPWLASALHHWPGVHRSQLQRRAHYKYLAKRK